MKRKTRIALPILLLVVMMLTALLAFTFTANAEDTTEAKIAAYTITYGTDDKVGLYPDYPVEKSTALISDSSATGSFASLAESLATVAPAEKTRYILTLNKDVTVSSPIVIAANANTEIWINLAGHTLTSTVDGPLLTLSGTGATVRIFGEFNDDGSYGKFVASKANGAFVRISNGSTDFVDVNYVDCVFTGNANNTAMFIAEGGKLTFEHSSIAHTSGGSAAMFDVKDAKLNIKYSHFEGGKSATLVKSSASKVYIEGGYMIGYALVESDATASDVVITGLECEVDTAFIQGSADTNTYVLGSTMEIYTAIASGAATADNLIFYYGDGTMTVIGQDFSQYGVANSDVFSVTEAGGIWSMSYTGSNKVVTTVATVGQAPSVAFYDKLDTALEREQLGIGIAESDTATKYVDMKDVTDSTVRIATLLADVSETVGANFYGSEDASLIIDLNGYNFTNGSTSGSNILTVANQLHVRIDGSGAGGRSKIVGPGKTQRLIYVLQASASGQISKHLVVQCTNFDLEATNLRGSGASSSAPIDCCAGYLFLENVNLVYSGTGAGESTLTASGNSNLATLMYLAHDSFKEGVVFMDNVSVSDTSTNGMIVTGVRASYNWRLFVSNFKAEGVDVAFNAASSGTTYRITDSTINSADVVFAGAGKAYVTDTTISTPTGNLCSGTIAPHFYYGSGKTVINIGTSSILNGSTSAEDGYSVGIVDEGIYKVVSSTGAHSITMPAVFSSGMMLQRNKVINVYGYCDQVGATVRVTIGDVSSDAVVGSDGKWKATFAPMEAATDVIITIDQLGAGAEGTPDVQFGNVNIGEIWVMSGQSNAELRSGYLEDVEELAILCSTLNIREFKSTGYSLSPDRKGNGTWKNVSYSSVKSTESSAMSAAGYATVARLSAELGPDVPVGLITLAQGSTKISTWIDYEHLSELSPWLAARYDQYKTAGSLPSSAHGSNAVPTILYNRHVYPLEGFTTAGVMWYQGCGDIPGKYYKSAEAGEANVHYLGPEGRTYTEFFTALEEVYRRAFDNGGDDLPFYVMQLAPYSRSGDGPSDGSYIYEFRLEQYEFCKALDNTYLVSVANEGMAFTSQDVEGGAFIHPARKSPIGNRTADMILANEYGIKFAEVVSYPEPIAAVRNADGTVTLTFDTDIQLSYGDTVEGFELSANGTTWVKASGTINGKTLTLSASGVTAATELRYGFGKTQVELRDGTVIEIKHGGDYGEDSDGNKITPYKLVGSQYTVIDDITRNEYVINVDSTDVIRTKNHGNITNASGIPLVLFSMDVTAG